MRKPNFVYQLLAIFHWRSNKSSIVLFSIHVHKVFEVNFSKKYFFNLISTLFSQNPSKVLFFIVILMAAGLLDHFQKASPLKHDPKVFLQNTQFFSMKDHNIFSQSLTHRRPITFTVKYRRLLCVDNEEKLIDFDKVIRHFLQKNIRSSLKCPQKSPRFPLIEVHEIFSYSIFLQSGVFMNCKRVYSQKTRRTSHI